MTSFETSHNLDGITEWIEAETRHLDEVAEILPQVSRAVERRKAQLAEDPVQYFVDEAIRTWMDRPLTSELETGQADEELGNE